MDSWPTLVLGTSLGANYSSDQFLRFKNIVNLDKEMMTKIIYTRPSFTWNWKLLSIEEPIIFV